MSRRIRMGFPYEVIIDELSTHFGSNFAITTPAIIDWFKDFFRDNQRLVRTARRAGEKVGASPPGRDRASDERGKLVVVGGVVC